MNFYIMANIAGGGLVEEGMSGGDRIALACLKKWTEKGHQVKIFTGKSGQKIYQTDDSKDVEWITTSFFLTKKSSYIRLFLFELVSLFGGIIRVLKDKYLLEIETAIYSASDFWPDVIPALILKLKNAKATWIAGFYQFAPFPWRSDTPYKAKKWFIGFIYWLSQLPIYYIIKKYADYVFVTSEPDVAKFLTKKRKSNNIVVVRGGIQLQQANKFLNSNQVIPISKRKYDAVFVGRLHYQKGTIELIDIWKLVCERRPTAKLAMVGSGSLEGEVKKKIEQLTLQENIELLGFRDGEEKYEIFKQSKIVIHPATYDSGGMAACEAMAWGLPGVSFNLEALKTYYPKGMLKTPCYNLAVFAENIVRLLENKSLYEKISADAVEWAKDWDWEKRADLIYNKVI